MTGKAEDEHIEVAVASPAAAAAAAKTSSELAEMRGRAIQQQEHNRSYWLTLRSDPWLLFWIGVMLWTIGVRGFENKAGGAIMSITYFKQHFGELNAEGNYFIATNWQSALSGGGMAFSIIGAAVASSVVDYTGFKSLILVTTLINIASVGIEFGSTSIAMFFAGKMVNSIAIGAYQNLCTAYVADISPLVIRASVIGFCNLAQCIGPFIAAIMTNYTAKWENDWSWRAVVCAQWGFAVIALIGQLFMPESPVHLVRKGQLAAARSALGRMYTKPDDADGHLERIKLTIAEASAEASLSEAPRGAGGSYLDCFRGTNCRRTNIAIFVFVAEAMSGLGFIGSYGSLMYQYLGISDEKSFHYTIGAEVLSMSGATLAFFVADMYGRRPMFLFGCASITVLLLCMAISGSVTTTAGTTASVGFYTMFNFVYNFGLGSGVYAIAGEIPTSVLRSKTLAISMSTSNATNTMWSFVCPYIFNPGYGNLKAKISFIFGAIMAIWTVIAYYVVPETRGRTYEELDELFMSKVATRQFKSYVTVAEQRASEAYTAEKKDIHMPDV